MKFYSTIPQDISKLKSTLESIETGMLFADKNKFEKALNEHLNIIKLIKDKCNE